MLEAEVTIHSGVGLHARPAASLVREAARHACRLTVHYAGREADAKSVLQVLALGVKDGETIRLRAEGPGEEAALKALVALLEAEGRAQSAG